MKCQSFYTDQIFQTILYPSMEIATNLTLKLNEIEINGTYEGIRLTILSNKAGLKTKPHKIC